MLIEKSESENEDNRSSRDLALESARPRVVERFVALKLSWSDGSQSSSQASKVSSTTNTFLCDDDLAKFLEDVLLSQNTR
jgi:protein involved in ribonucleotide reduction